MQVNPAYLVDIIDERIQKAIRRMFGNMSSLYSYGTWVQAESVDANLSQVTLAGTEDIARFVPKGAHVTGLTAGDTVLMVRAKGAPLTIIARVVGDITLAED
jgi:hypothetical protein